MSTEAIILNALIAIVGFAGFCWWMNALFNRSYIHRKPAPARKKAAFLPWNHKDSGRGER